MFHKEVMTSVPFGKEIPLWVVAYGGAVFLGFLGGLAVASTLIDYFVHLPPKEEITIHCVRNPADSAIFSCSEVRP